MKDNTLTVIVAEAGLGGIAVVALIMGDMTIAAAAAGALAGVVGGHLNGSQTGAPA